MRVGQKAHIKDQVGIAGQAVFVSETDARYQNRLLASRVLLEPVGQVRPQFMNVKFGSVNDQVGERPRPPQMPPLCPKRCPHRRTLSQWMGPPRLAVAPQQRGIT